MDTVFCSRRLYLSVQWPINEKRHWNSQGVCFTLDISTISAQANKTELCDTIFKVGLLRFCLFKHTYININMAWTELRWFGNITIPYLGCKLHGNGAGDHACMWVLKKYTLLLIRKEYVFCVLLLFLDLPLWLFVRGWLWERFYQKHVIGSFIRLLVNQLSTIDKPGMFISDTRSLP